jgi:hypothetical protein
LASADAAGSLLMDATLLFSIHLLPIALLWCPCLVICSLSQALYYDGTKSSYLHSFCSFYYVSDSLDMFLGDI